MNATEKAKAALQQRDAAVQERDRAVAAPGDAERERSRYAELALAVQEELRTARHRLET